MNKNHIFLTLIIIVLQFAKSEVPLGLITPEQTFRLTE